MSQKIEAEPVLWYNGVMKYPSSRFKALGFSLLAGLPWASALGDDEKSGIIPKEIEVAARTYDVTLDHVPLLFHSYAQGALFWAGGIAIIFVLVGGVQYVLGGLTDNKEQGKKTITYAIGGIILLVMAWFIVDFIIQFITE